MALPRKNFVGKINGKNAYDYTKKLDYTLDTYEERKALVDRIFENDDFFVEYYDNYYKVDVSQDDFLTEDNNICQALEKITNYLLFAPDKKENKKDVEYVFYNKRKLDKKLNKDLSLEEILENQNSNIIVFYEDDSKNYKKEIKQVIKEEDYDDPEIGQYLTECQDAIRYYGKKIDNKEVDNYKAVIKLRTMMKEIKSDMILVKDKVKGTIYFKSPMPDEGLIEWWLCNFTDKNHIKALLKCKEKNLLTEYGIIIYDFKQLLKSINFTSEEIEVLDLYSKENETTTSDIAKELGLERHIVSTILNKICSKIIKKYKEQWEDWVHLNWIKGEYKKCLTCGEVKLIQSFYKKDDNKDKLHNSCKQCMKS